MKVIKITLAAVILLGGVLAFNACQTLNPPIEDFNWVLVEWVRGADAKTILPDTQISAFFKNQDKTVSGSSGCNQYRGTYKVDGLSLTINNDIAMTEIYCSAEKNDQERQYLNALKAATSYKMDHGNLIIYCGVDTLRFKQSNVSTTTISHWGE
jgi:heat shock protein HslJ